MRSDAIGCVRTCSDTFEKFRKFWEILGFFEQLISNIGVPGMGRGGPAIGSGRASD